MKYLIISLLTLSSIPMAWAAEPAQSSLISFLPLLLIVVAFYFLLIRPQSKRAKEHKQLLLDLKKGDEVVINGGLVGKIEKESESFLYLKIAENTQVQVQRQAVSQRLPKNTFETK